MHHFVPSFRGLFYWLITIIALGFFAGFVGGCRGVSDEEIEKQVLYEMNTGVDITDWLSERTFITVQEVRKLYATDIGRVVVKRIGDKELFNILVSPYREIKVGSEVKIIKLTYLYNRLRVRSNIFLAK